jgi:NodT family efflux transporter outer membrane factor (OMF) lipoprotein
MSFADMRVIGGRPCVSGFRRLAMVAGLAMLLGSCAVGPDFKIPLSPEIGNFTPERLQASNSAGGKVQRFSTSVDLPAEYWTLFHSNALNSLVARALKDNPNLEAARAAIRVAQANVYAQVGTLLPQASGDYTGQGGKIATTTNNNGGVAAPVIAPGGVNPSYYSLHTAQVAVSFVPDVWGGNRRQIESLDAVKDNQRFMNEATLLTLTSAIALGAIQEAALREQISVTERLIRISKDILDKIKLQKNLGQLTELDVAGQEALVAQTEATLPPLRKALDQQRDALTVLSGHLPGEGLPERFHFTGLKLPRMLPVSLPSKLVTQRPDVRAAEENMRAANALIGAAIANRLPQFSLTGNIGREGPLFQNLFSNNPAFYFYTGIANASQVIFDGFTLQQRQRAAEAGFDEAAALYRLAVLTAFQNVADSLYAIKHDTTGLQKALLAEVAAKKSLDLTRLQLAEGQIAIQQVLTAQTTYLQASLVVVQAQTARYSDTVALFQALGGGWWSRNAPEPAGPVKSWLVSVTGIEPDPNLTAYPGATKNNAR